MPVPVCFVREGLGLHPFLLRGDSFPLFVGADKVAAIKEAGLQSDVINVVVRV